MAVKELANLEEALKELVESKKGQRYKRFQDAHLGDIDCEICEATGWIVAERGGRLVAAGRCSCVVLKAKETKSNILADIFGYHEIAKLKPEQQTFTKRHVASNKGSLWLTGRSGAGKSAYCYHLLENYEGTVQGCRGVDLPDEFRDQTHLGAWLKKKVEIKADVFAIDDIDKAKMSEAVKNDMYELIDRFCRTDVMCVFTSNMNLDEFLSQWPKHMSSPLERRIRIKFNIIDA